MYLRKQGSIGMQKKKKYKNEKTCGVIGIQD